MIRTGEPIAAAARSNGAKAAAMGAGQSSTVPVAGNPFQSVLQKPRLATAAPHVDDKGVCCVYLLFVYIPRVLGGVCACLARLCLKARHCCMTQLTLYSPGPVCVRKSGHWFINGEFNFMMTSAV